VGKRAVVKSIGRARKKSGDINKRSFQVAAYFRIEADKRMLI